MGRGRRVVVVCCLFAAACGDPEPDSAGETDGDSGFWETADSGPSGGPTEPPETSGASEGGSEGGGSEDSGDPPDAQLPYNQATFAASHNSYAGAFLDGDVGTIHAQLEAGLRFLELDIHTDDYAEFGYRVGHDSPGHGVALGNGNPESDALPAWLDVIAAWSDEHEDHAPITLLVDFKDTIPSDGYDAGNFSAFNELMETTFGRDRLFTPDDLGNEWPLVDDMRGQILLVLSGDEDAQLAYRRDGGVNPAMAINGSGQVVEVHNSESDADELWLWTGQVAEDGHIDWLQHDKYDTGEHPAVAINDDGLIIEVHEDHDTLDDDLWYRVGRLGPDYEVVWSTDGGQRFPGNDEGERPTLAFVDPAGSAVREVHKSQSNDQHWYWLGETVDEASGTIAWARPDGDGRTDDALYPTASTTYGDWTYDIEATTSGPHEPALVVHGPMTQRVRYVQLAFGSAREDTKDSLMNDGLLFFADDARIDSGRAFIRQKREQGFVTRLWAFNEALRDEEDDGLVNFAASDIPFAEWYAEFCEATPCVR